MSKVYRWKDGSIRDYPEALFNKGGVLSLPDPTDSDVYVQALTKDQIEEKISRMTSSQEQKTPRRLMEDVKQEIKNHEEKKNQEGLRYNSGKLRWRNFPMFLLRPVVEVGDKAEKRDGNVTGKYPTLNFLKGLKVQDTLDCLHRHLDKMMDPNEPDYDPEDGAHHLAKIAWNALVALYYIENKPEFDDRELKYEKNK